MIEATGFDVLGRGRRRGAYAVGGVIPEYKPSIAMIICAMDETN
jgi:hypothetical protein